MSTAPAFSSSFEAVSPSSQCCAAQLEVLEELLRCATEGGGSAADGSHDVSMVSSSSVACTHQSNDAAPADVVAVQGILEGAGHGAGPAANSNASGASGRNANHYTRPLTVRRPAKAVAAATAPSPSPSKANGGRGGSALLALKGVRFVSRLAPHANASSGSNDEGNPSAPRNGRIGGSNGPEGGVVGTDDEGRPTDHTADAIGTCEAEIVLDWDFSVKKGSQSATATVVADGHADGAGKVSPTASAASSLSRPDNSQRAARARPTAARGDDDDAEVIYSASVSGALLSKYVGSVNSDGGQSSPPQRPPTSPGTKAGRLSAASPPPQAGTATTDKRKKAVSIPLPKSMARLVTMGREHAARGWGTAAAGGAHWHLTVKPAAVPSTSASSQQGQSAPPSLSATANGSTSAAEGSSSSARPRVPPIVAPSSTASRGGSTSSTPRQLAAAGQLDATAYELFLVCVHPCSWLERPAHGGDGASALAPQPSYARPTTSTSARAVSAVSSGAARGGRLPSLGGGSAAILASDAMAADAPLPEPVTVTAFRCTVVVSLSLEAAEHHEKDVRPPSSPSTATGEHSNGHADATPRHNATTIFRSILYTFDDEKDGDGSDGASCSSSSGTRQSAVCVHMSFSRLWSRASHYGASGSAQQQQGSGVGALGASTLGNSSSSAAGASLGLSGTLSGGGGNATVSSYTFGAGGGACGALLPPTATGRTASEAADAHSTAHLLQPPTLQQMKALVGDVPARRIATRNCKAPPKEGVGKGGTRNAADSAPHQEGEGEEGADAEEEPHGTDGEEGGAAAAANGGADVCGGDAPSKARRRGLERIPNPLYKPVTLASVQFDFARSTRSAGMRANSTAANGHQGHHSASLHARPASTSTSGGHHNRRGGAALSNSYSAGDGRRSGSSSNKRANSGGMNRAASNANGAPPPSMKGPKPVWAFERPALGAHVWEPILNTVATPSLVEQRKEQQRRCEERMLSAGDAVPTRPLFRSEATSYAAAFRVLGVRYSTIPSYSHMVLQLVVAGVWEVAQHVEVLKEVVVDLHNDGEDDDDPIEYDDAGEPSMIYVRRTRYVRRAEQFTMASVTLMRRVTSEGAAAVGGNGANSDGYSDGGNSDMDWLGSTYGGFGGTLNDTATSNTVLLMSTRPGSGGGGGRDGSPLATGRMSPHTARPGTPLSNSMTLPRPSSGGGNNSSAALMIPPLSATVVPPAVHQPKPLRRTQRVAVVINAIPTTYEDVLRHAVEHTIIPTAIFKNGGRAGAHAHDVDGDDGHRDDPVTAAMRAIMANREVVYAGTVEKAASYFLKQKLSHLWQIDSSAPASQVGSGGKTKPAHVFETRPSTGGGSGSVGGGSSPSSSAAGTTRTPTFLSRLKGASPSSSHHHHDQQQQHVEQLPSAASLRSGVVVAVPREVIEGYRHNDFTNADVVADTADTGNGATSSCSNSKAGRHEESYLHAHPQTRGVYGFHTPSSAGQHSVPTVLSANNAVYHANAQQPWPAVHVPTPFSTSAIRKSSSSSSSSMHVSYPLYRVVTTRYDGTDLFIVVHAQSQLPLMEDDGTDRAAAQRRLEKRKSSSSSPSLGGKASGKGKGSGGDGGGAAGAYFILVCPTTALPSTLVTPARRSRLTFAASFVGYVPIPARVSAVGVSVGGGGGAPAGLFVAGSSVLVPSADKALALLRNEGSGASTHNKSLSAGASTTAPLPLPLMGSVSASLFTSLRVLAFADEGRTVVVPLPQSSSSSSSAAGGSQGGGGYGEFSSSSSPSRGGGGRGVNAPDLKLWATRAENEDGRRHATARAHHGYLMPALMAMAADGTEGIANGGDHDEEGNAASNDDGSDAQHASPSPIASEGNSAERSRGAAADGGGEEVTPLPSPIRHHGSRVVIKETAQDHQKDRPQQGDRKPNAKGGAADSSAAAKRRSLANSTVAASPAESDALKRAIVQEYLLCNSQEDKLVKAKGELRAHIGALVSSYTEEDFTRDLEVASSSVGGSFSSRPASGRGAASPPCQSNSSPPAAAGNSASPPSSTTVVFTHSIRSRREIKVALAKYVALDEQHEKLREYQHVLLDQILPMGAAADGSIHPGSDARRSSYASSSDVAASPVSPSRGGHLKGLPPPARSSRPTTPLTHMRPSPTSSTRRQSTASNNTSPTKGGPGRYFAASTSTRNASVSVSDAAIAGPHPHHQPGAAQLWEGRTRRLQQALADQRDDLAQGTVSDMLSDWLDAEDEKQERERLVSATVREAVHSATNTPRYY